MKFCRYNAIPKQGSVEFASKTDQSMIFFIYLIKASVVSLPCGYFVVEIQCSNPDHLIKPGRYPQTDIANHDEILEIGVLYLLRKYSSKPISETVCYHTSRNLQE